MDLSFGMVPMGLRFVVVPISLVVCVCVCFFFKVALVDVGLCQWWLVGVIAVGGHCCSNGGCAIVVDVDDREKIIYYFNV